MIAHGNSGWLTTLADLSIILFMITAADLSNAQVQKDRPREMVEAVTTAEAVAIYRPEAGVIPFGEWLAMQPADDRQRVTVLVRYTGTDEQQLIRAGLNLAEPAEQAGKSPRMIVERANRADVVAMLTYDADPAAVAHNLLETSDQQRLEKSQ